MKTFIRLSLVSAIIFFSTLVLAEANRDHPSKDKGLKSRPNYDYIKHYDCSGKPNGSYIHPWDCTRFIKCSNGYASDMACPDCDLPNSQCMGDPYLRWDDEKVHCEYPQFTECVPGPTPGPTEDPPTTTAKTTTTTPAPTDASPSPTPNPTSGCHKLVSDSAGKCTEDDCQPCGYCSEMHSYYFRCQRTFPSDPKLNITGVWVHEFCDDDLWWNPDRKPTLDAKEESEGWGGACDHWDNLSDETKAAYEEDENCVQRPVVCLWGQDEEDSCSGNYWYLDPKTMKHREDLQCSKGLIWDQSSETCRDCSHVVGCECK